MVFSTSMNEPVNMFQPGHELLFISPQQKRARKDYQQALMSASSRQTAGISALLKADESTDLNTNCIFNVFVCFCEDNRRVEKCNTAPW